MPLTDRRDKSVVGRVAGFDETDSAGSRSRQNQSSFYVRKN